MTVFMKKTALVTVASILAASCAGGAFNGADDALTIAEEHPIAVDTQIVTLTVNVDPSMAALSSIDTARLRAFANAYMTNGHGPLTVTAPSGTTFDFDGQEAAADIRGALYDAGIPWSAINGATYRTGDAAGGQLILSYTHYVATPSECGVWAGIKGRDYRNLRSPNMGCATMNNYAAMIADPRDLVTPADRAPVDGQATARVIDKYRRGELTASAIDGDIETDVAGN